MRQVLLFFTLIPLLFSFCKPEEICQNCPIPPDTLSNTGPFKVLWQIPLNSDTADCISMKPIVYNGNVLYSLLFYIDGYEYLRMVDGKTGAFKWSWDPSWPGETLSRGSRFAKDNIFVMTHWGPTYGIDMNTGQNLWANNVNDDESSGKAYLSGIGDFLYTEHSAKILEDTASYCVRANIHTGIWDTLFVLKIEDGYRPGIMPPSLWVSSQGDSILIFQNRQWNFSQSDGRIDMLAYNLRTHAFEWKLKDFDPNGNSNIDPPLIYENKIYFQAEKHLYCFDAATGNQLWKWKTPQDNDNLMSASLLAAEGKIFVKPNNEKSLYGLNPLSGNVEVQISNAGSGQGVMSYYNGIIYYASGGSGALCAVRPSTREVIWNDFSPNHNRPGKWNHHTVFDDVTVSPELGCLFASDHYFLMAIKLPD
ncbi:MAG: PQQ-like beta-propeller repeat protein [Saprospiraceae bacterium]|nr:PQQ-like beta-propeller repeat protein [Saprospiraceae bacterium]